MVTPAHNKYCQRTKKSWKFNPCPLSLLRRPSLLHTSSTFSLTSFSLLFLSIYFAPFSYIKFCSPFFFSPFPRFSFFLGRGPCTLPPHHTPCFRFLLATSNLPNAKSVTIEAVISYSVNTIKYLTSYEARNDAESVPLSWTKYATSIYHNAAFSVFTLIVPGSNQRQSKQARSLMNNVDKI